MLKRWLSLLLLPILLVSCASKTELPPQENVVADVTPADNEIQDKPLILTEDYTICAEPSNASLAETVQAAIQAATGLELSIVTDGTACSQAIIVGDSRYDETKMIRASITSPFVGVAARVDEALVLTGGCDGATEQITLRFAQALGALVTDGALQIPSAYRMEERFDESLTQEVLTSLNAKDAVRISVSGAETFRIFTPRGTDGWYYNHIPFITKFKDRFYVFYNSSPTNEEDCGQRLMLATSRDCKTWSVRTLVDSVAGTNSDCVLNGRGCYERDGTLTFFYQMYEYDASTLRTDANGKPLRPLAENSKGRTIGIFYIQTTDGVHWTTPVNLGYIAGGNSSPEQIPSGGLLWAGHSSAAYTDDLTGTAGWNNVFLQLDPNTAPTPSSFESDFFVLSDGSIVMFSRTGDDVMLAAVSFDGGKTWSDLHRTDFPDYNARFRFGTLPDGRYYYLGNRSPERRELVLMTSVDGLNFDTCYELITGDYTLLKQGLYKGGVYGYPDVFFDEDYMYVAYSLKKESMELLRIPLFELEIP